MVLNRDSVNIDMTHIYSFRHITTVEHKASAVFVTSGWFCRLQKGELLNGSVTAYTIYCI